MQQLVINSYYKLFTTVAQHKKIFVDFQRSATLHINEKDKQLSENKLLITRLEKIITDSNATHVAISLLFLLLHQEKKLEEICERAQRVITSKEAALHQRDTVIRQLSAQLQSVQLAIVQSAAIPKPTVTDS